MYYAAFSKADTISWGLNKMSVTIISSLGTTFSLITAHIRCGIILTSSCCVAVFTTFPSRTAYIFFARVFNWLWECGAAASIHHWHADVNCFCHLTYCCERTATARNLLIHLARFTVSMKRMRNIYFNKGKGDNIVFVKPNIDFLLAQAFVDFSNNKSPPFPNLKVTAVNFSKRVFPHFTLDQQIFNV